MNRVFKAINKLLKVSKRSASVRSLFFTSLLLRMVVGQSSTVLKRYSKLASSIPSRRMPRSKKKLLKPIRRFSANCRRKRSSNWWRNGRSSVCRIRCNERGRQRLKSLLSRKLRKPSNFRKRCRISSNRLSS